MAQFLRWIRTYGNEQVKVVDPRCFHSQGIQSHVLTYRLVLHRDILPCVLYTMWDRAVLYLSVRSSPLSFLLVVFFVS